MYCMTKQTKITRHHEKKRHMESNWTESRTDRSSRETMNQGSESPPTLTDSQQTTSEEESESTAHRDENSSDEHTRSHGDSSELLADQNNTVGISGGQEPEEDGAECLYTEFREQVEVFFSRAEDTITSNHFDLACAKNLVLRVRDVGERYSDKGCDKVRLEDIVVNRALTTVDRLVDGVQTRAEELFDPRQTMVYVYCAMAVFPCTLYLRRSDGWVRFKLSPGASVCLQLLDELSRYCAIKADCEGAEGWEHTISHTRLLLDLAEWLELERAPVTFLITNKTLPVMATLVNRFALVIQLQDRFKRLGEAAMVLAASSLVRADMLREARAYDRLLQTVDSTRLTPGLATRRQYVHARLLQSCGQVDKALDWALDALQDVTDAEERQEIETLVRELRESQEPAAHHSSPHGPPDFEWLEGTHVLQHQSRADPRDTTRQRRRSQSETRRRTPRTVPVSRRGETPDQPPVYARQPQAPAHDLLTNAAHLSASAFGFYNNNHPANDPTRDRLNIERLLNTIDLDESDNEDEEYDEQDIRLVDSSDEEREDDHAESVISFFDDTATVVTAETLEDGKEDDNRDWYEKSEEFIESEEIDEVEAEIHLSEEQSDKLKRGRGRGFYPDFHPNPQQLLKDDPKKYKRCQLKIERSHKSIARVLDKGSKYSEVLIEGRSKAGRSYMDDEVVVEILREPGTSTGLQQSVGAGSTRREQCVETMACGKVVGLINRVHFANVEHPVLFCTLDHLESHLMKPLCKTVPKIHVLNNNVREKYPALLKNRIEIKTVSPDGEIKFRGYCDVQPDKREQYVFKVAILSWRQGNIYPLGAVLDAHIGGKNYSGGLEVLSMQQRVPKCYPRAAVEDVKKIVQDPSVSKGRREDLTTERLFTIDPPGSKDLDDAISIRTEGPHVVIGVHIADVAAVVKKGSGLDLEARRRAVTFYPLQRQPRCMLPEPLSHGKCSLLPGQERLAFSVFFRFNQKGKQVADPEVKKTVIKSRQQLTYEEAQKVIDGDRRVKVEPSIQDDIRQIHKITAKLREDRRKLSVFFVPFEDPRLPELEQLNECLEAHALIEELMVLTNSYIASRLNKRPRYRDCMIVRCHKAPTYEDLAEWQEKEGHVTNLVMNLQGTQVTPGSRLSVENPPPVRAFPPQPPVLVQRQVWEKLCRHLEFGEGQEARTLAFMDALHPLQCLANNSWMDMMETAEYRCAYGLNSPQLRHFGLSLDVYTHFTSPIRRYADLHVQRLLHADLDGRSADCDPSEVTELCQHINSATSRQKAFGKGCMSLKVADNLQRQPLVFRAYVDAVNDEQLTVFVPSLHKVSDRKQELPFSVLGVSSQPEVVTDTALKQQSVTVKWKKRFYGDKEKIPMDLQSLVKRQEKSEDKGPEKSGDKSSGAITLNIRPDQLTATVRQEDWIQILKKLTSSPAADKSRWENVPQKLSRDTSGVDYLSSEKRDGTISLKPVHFQRVYRRGQIVQIQMSAGPSKGILKPRVETLHIASNATVCTPHVHDPVQTLSRTATRATRDQQFTSYRQYLKAWMPLLEMEAAVGAGAGDACVVIDDVAVTFKAQTSSNSVLYRGTFTLKTKYCYDHCIEFGGVSVDRIDKEEYKSDHSFPLDYLCLRYRSECGSAVTSRIAQSAVADAVDRHFTWLAHACVVQVLRQKRKAPDGGHIMVVFALSPSSPPPPPQLMTKAGGKVTLEILPKTAVDRRSQEMLLQLEDPRCELAQSIAYGRTIPKLDPDHKRLGNKDENHEVHLAEEEDPENPIRRLPFNNRAQLDAIRMAMTNSLAIIQGPPGTGKTKTGIKLVFLFCKVNRQLQAEGKGKKTVLYCGPSNKSVDLVARELKSKLGSECPSIVRVYGSAIENKDYPVPVENTKSTRGVRDLTSDRDLQDVTLHHLIREEGKPFAEHLAMFQKYFDKCRTWPDRYSVSREQLQKYYKLVSKASVTELKHHEVVLCTCSVGGNRKVMMGTDDSVYQLIIDECAMSPEPQSLVPIVATTPRQLVLIGDHKQLRPIITCQAAAELGLDQSLFERLFQKFPAYSVFLDYQYRMNPYICEFPSNKFYCGKLVTRPCFAWNGPPLLRFWPTDPTGSDKRVPHLLIDVRGEEETLTVTTDEGNERSKSNRKEADKVIEILTFLRKKLVDLSNIRLLTQYNAQRHLLEEKLKTVIRQNTDSVFDHYDAGKINVSTVVSSQGGEWDYVILSTVRSLPSYKIEPNPTLGWCRSNLGSITDCNQVNVALTRARKGLFIVGNVELLRCDQVWSRLVDRYTHYRCYIEDPDTFPPKDARRRTKKWRQQNARSSWQQVPSRSLPPMSEEAE
ncbi:3'-5' exoribonuclease HELZ2-like isoform X2 [Babylonia areolata]|uniref:3'-5' exoribonuclease HELZ2-like isoform X2 n=1 Tax=Babylonia areolata TaxID=304850 RepID=UPI003FD0434B